MVERLSDWSVRHRALAIGGWFALVVVALIGGSLLAGGSARTHDAGESGTAQRALLDRHVDTAGQEVVLVEAPDAATMRATAGELAGALRAVGTVHSPLDDPRLVGKDSQTGLVTVEIDDTADYRTMLTAVGRVAERRPDVRFSQAGDTSLAAAVDDSIGDDFARAERITLPLTLAILLVVFGSLIAAGIPLLLAATAVASTFGILQVVDDVVPVNSATSSMILLIGMAVGIDYSLFYVRREREERLAGRDVTAALGVAARTSGRVVVVSGLTVIACLTGLVITGLDAFRGLAVGTVLVVGLAVLGSVTVLPALLAALGPRVDRARLPWLGRRRTRATESRFWGAVAARVVRHPAVWGGVAVLFLLVLAIPAVGIHLQDAARTESLPRGVPTIGAALRIEHAFPGATSPARVVVWGATDTPAARQGIADLRAHADGPTTVDSYGDGVVLVRVPLAGAGTDDESNRSLARLREQLLPATLGRVDGVHFAVTGRTAIAHDFAQQMGGRAPYVVAFVLVLAFVLLLIAFRSLMVPLVSIVLNLLSVGAAYGVLVWVFQDGHLGSLLGFTSYGGVVGWLPLFLFVMLFGLSMDYHIFILSRIRERRSSGAGMREAIVGGVATSAGVVTSAAVIMVGVFSIFVTLTAIEYKMLGVGMAVAILVDATIVRGVLLPAAMALVGRHVRWGRPVSSGHDVGREVVPHRGDQPVTQPEDLHQ